MIGFRLSPFLLFFWPLLLAACAALVATFFAWLRAAFLRSVPFIVASRSPEGLLRERGGFRVAPRRKVLLVEESDVVGEGADANCLLHRGQSKLNNSGCIPRLKMRTLSPTNERAVV